MTSSTHYDPRDLDKYDYSISNHLVGGVRGKLRKFLWFCAGADLNLIKHSPHSDRVKFDGLGGVVLATAVLAFFSGSYAFYTVFAPKIGDALSAQQQATDIPTAIFAVIFGLLWSLIIFNLDRFIVTSTGHGDGTEKITRAEFVQGIPRILMAVAIGFSLSKPLEIRIMKTEIEAKLTEAQEQYKMDRDAAVKAEFDRKMEPFKTAKLELDQKIKHQDQLYEEMKSTIDKQRIDLGQEAAGQSGNKKAGEGPGYRAKKENLDKMESDLAEMKQKNESGLAGLKDEPDRNEKEINALNILKEAKMDANKSKANHLDGLITRIKLAEEISFWGSWCLSILLIIIEVSPVLIKMMLIRGSYDSLVDNQTNIVRAKYAIETLSHIDVDSNGHANEHPKEQYHQADAIREFNVGALLVEKHLAKVAQETFQNKTSEGIKLNPEKYIQDGSRDA